MNKLYVGNLPLNTTEYSLQNLLNHHHIQFNNIAIKEGYAFVECVDQSAADRAVDCLNGICFQNSNLIVEPSFKTLRKQVINTFEIDHNYCGVNPKIVLHTYNNNNHHNNNSYNSRIRKMPSRVGNGQGPSCKIIVSQLPNHCRFEDLEPMLIIHGTIQDCEKLQSRDPNTQTVQITYDTPEQAKQAAMSLNEATLDGSTIKAELVGERKNNYGRKSNRSNNYVANPSMVGQAPPQPDFPLRILVQSDMVGAIIGKQGSTIRQITQQTRARVDVHRRDNIGALEKAITIYGNPENCTNACKKLLEVMQQEATSTNKGEIALKILAHNNLIGRIIGKGGNTIKKIMMDTDTKITVSSINDINSFNLERTISVRGTVDNMSKAEALISAKLRQSYEHDIRTMAPQSVMFPGLHPMVMMSTSGMAYGGRGMYPGQQPYPNIFPPPQLQGAGDTQETTFLYIPNNAVGAIIGTKGSHIRNIMRYSGASVKIASIEGEKVSETPMDRRVTIVGNPESQWKAQYLIFEKMREEGFVSGSEDVRLTVEIFVPSSQVGRIIGKGGLCVRELQRLTGSVIKLPDQSTAPPHSEEETVLHIIGPFYSVQSAQRRIRSMIAQAMSIQNRASRGQRRESSSNQQSQQQQQQQSPQQSQQNQQSQQVQ